MSIAAGSLTNAHTGSYLINVEAVAGCSISQFSFNLLVTDCASDTLTVDSAGTFFSEPALTFQIGDSISATLNWDTNIVTSVVQDYPFDHCGEILYTLTNTNGSGLNAIFTFTTDSIAKSGSVSVQTNDASKA